jgi:beta-glucanase (GH16 family)
LLPVDQSWPPEIDLVEVTGPDPTTPILTYHSVGDGTPQAQVSTPDLSASWHTFAVDWRPGSLTWFIDDVPRFHVSLGVPTKPMYFLATLAVGGTEPGRPDGTTRFPASLDIDYVRVWQPA